MKPDYEALLLLMVRPFTRHPERMVVDVKRTGTSLFITLQAHRSDQGRLVGNQAYMVRALKALLLHAGKRHGDQVVFELLEPFPSKKEPDPQFSSDLTWDIEKDNDLCRLFYDIIAQVTGEPTLISSVIHKDYSEFTIGVDGPLFVSLSILFRAIGSARGRKLVLHDAAPAPSKAV